MVVQKSGVINLKSKKLDGMLDINIGRPIKDRFHCTLLELTKLAEHKFLRELSFNVRFQWTTYLLSSIK